MQRAVLNLHARYIPWIKVPMPPCRFCEEDFKNEQSVKAHLRHCKVYKKLPKAGPLPKADHDPSDAEEHRGMPRTTKRIHSDDVEVLSPRQHPGRDSHESLMNLLDIHEILGALLKDGMDNYGYVRLVESMRKDDEPGCHEWKQL